MTDSFIGITTPGAPTAKIDSESLTVGANTVERERVQLVGRLATQIAAILSTAPASGDFGLVVRSGDGHDAGLGSTTDAAGAAGAAGSASSKLRRVTTDLDALLTKAEAIRALLAATIAISAASLPLPAGAATQATLAALLAALPAALGQTDMSSSLPVVLPTDQGMIPVMLDATALDANGAFPTAEQYGVSTGGGHGNLFIISAASTNAQVVKGSKGQVYAITFNNLSDSKRYLKFYNKATTPNPAADTPLWGLVLGEQSDGHINIPKGLDIFSAGIGLAITGGSAAADVTAIGAGEVWLDVGYY